MLFESIVYVCMVEELTVLTTIKPMQETPNKIQRIATSTLQISIHSFKVTTIAKFEVSTIHSPSDIGYLKI